ncbi:hypothetical protein KKD03_02765 [Patescibacteria group bacterium]|nr:hypothetical protein [Patescibacteria group bacterium]
MTQRNFDAIYRQPKNFAALWESQKRVLRGRNYKRKDRRESPIIDSEPHIELMQESMQPMIFFANTATRNLNLVWPQASSNDRKLALKLAQREIERTDSTPDNDAKRKPKHTFDAPPRVAYLVFLLLLLWTVYGCTTAPSIDATAPPPPVATEVVPIPTETVIDVTVPPTQVVVPPPPVTDVDTSIPPEVYISGTLTSSPEAPTQEADPEQLPLYYPITFGEWINAGDHDADEEKIMGQDEIGLAAAEDILRDQAENQGINVKEILVTTAGLTRPTWSIVIRDTNDQIWYAVGTDTHLPYAQLFPYLVTTRDAWELATNPLSAPNNYQDILQRENGEVYTIVEKNEDGDPLFWMDLKDGKMVPIINARLDLDTAIQAVPETVSINGDYGYNTNGGVVAMFDEEKGWIPIPFGKEDYDGLVEMQWNSSGGSNEYSQGMLVLKVHEYGKPNEGAVPIQDANRNIVYYVAVSADVINLNSQGEPQVTKIPIILYSADEKSIVILTLPFDEHKIPEPLDYWYNILLPTIMYNRIQPEAQTWYDDPTAIYYGYPTTKKPELGMGDRLTAYFLKENVTSKDVQIAPIIKAMGLIPSSVNGPGFASYLQTGDIPDTSTNQGLLLPDKISIRHDVDS